MFQYKQIEKTEEANFPDLLEAYRLFRESNKTDFLEFFGKDIERVYKEALCLRELSCAIGDNTGLIYAELTAKLAKILETEKCAIYTFDPVNNEYILESPIYGQTTAPLKLSRIKISSSEAEISEKISKLFGTQQVRCVYLQINERITGILAVANKVNKEQFNSDDDYLLNLCANNVAVMIENNKLYRQVQAQAARESVINRITNSIRSSLDLNTILNTAVNEVGAALKVSICSLLKFDYENDVALVNNEYNVSKEKGVNSVGTIIALHESAINRQILDTKKPVIINDTSTNPLIINYPATKYRIIDTIQAKSVLAVPIIFENKILGTLSLNQCDRARRWSHEDIQILESVASQLGVAMNHASLMSKVKALATKDELTGLINRRNFYERFIAEVERVKRYPSCLTFALFDIDFFKSVNDNYGHLAGDYVLKEIGRISAANVRKSDIVSRYGGEEFALVLPETTLKDGYELLERLRKRIEEFDFEFQSQKLKVTISGGIIQLGPLEDSNIDVNYLITESIDRADTLLYEAKKSGRNRICSE